MVTKIKKGAVKFLKLFITIDEIPFNDNGISKVHTTMYVFGARFASNVYPISTSNQN